MHSHNFAHRAAGRPNSTTQTNKTPSHQYATPSEQQTRRPNVRDFKRANRLTGLFSSAAERSVEAEAAWKASQSARRVAAARIQQEKLQQQADRAAKLVEEKERLAKELAKKQAALHEEELSKQARQRAAALNAYQEQFRKADAERKAGFVPDRMWPRENWQGVVFGDDYQAYKRTQKLKAADLGLSHEEILDQEFDYGPKSSGKSTKPKRFPNTFKKPSATPAPPPTKKAPGQQKRQRDFDEENPDDCWGHNNYEWAEAPPSGGVPNGYGSGGYSSPTPSYGEEQEEEEQGYNEYDRYHYNYHDNVFDEYYGQYTSDPGNESDSNEEDDADYGYGFEDYYDEGEFFRGEEWENFKKSWHGHSRQHHHGYYYTNGGNFSFNFGFGASGGTGRGAGGGAGTSNANVAVCKESAARAVQRAVQAVNSTSQVSNDGGDTNAGEAARQDEDVNAKMQEIQSAVISAAQHSGNDIAAFASALKIHVDHSKGQEYAKKMAKKGLLMNFHPDKLARAGVLQQYLGHCVTQLILTSVK